MEIDELKENFAHFDADGNGHIDFGEFSNLCDALESGSTEEEKRIGFGVIDTDGNGTIELEEFIAWWNER